MIVLSGDIGGTNTRLTLADVAINRVRLRAVERFNNAGVAGLDELLRRFLAGKPKPQAACLGVAGPTDGRTVHFTNLSWSIDSEEIIAETGISHVRLLNDFVALGYGLAVLDAGDCDTLQEGRPVKGGARLAVGAGTGLGMVQCVWAEGRYRPQSSEGGHIAFAPADARQGALLHFFRHYHERVSVERILSGPGIELLYRFCRREAGLLEDEACPNAATVSESALIGSDPLAVAALELFAHILGQTAGDLALVARATGGVYLAGGIAPRIRQVLQKPEFLSGFRAKGRFTNWMAEVPVHLVLDEDLAIKGAALAATLKE